MPNDDSYLWIGASGGTWGDAANWDDLTTGQDPATSVPGITSTATIAGPTGSVYEVIAGGGAAGSLAVSGYVDDLVGSYDAEMLTFGTTAIPGATTGDASGLMVSPGATLSAGTAAVESGELSVAGGGARLATSGTLTIGVQVGSLSGYGGVLVGGDATLDAEAPVDIDNGYLSMDGIGSVGTLAAGLTIGLTGTDPGGGDTPPYQGVGGLMVSDGATVAVAGTVDVVDGFIDVYGSAAALSVSGELVIGNPVFLAGEVLSATAGGSVTVGDVRLSVPNGFAEIVVDYTSLIEIGAGGTAAPGAITIDRGASLTAAGSTDLRGNVVNDGVIIANGPALTVTDYSMSGGSTLSGSGTIVLGSDTELDMDADVTAGGTIAFGNAADTLVIGAFGSSVINGGSFGIVYDPYVIGATLLGFAAGDAITYSHETLTGDVYTASGPDDGFLALSAGTQSLGTLELAGDYSGRSFVLVANAAGTNAVTVEPAVACYLAGTRILTPRGEIPVESLAIGDLVNTLQGVARPIRWIGRRSYDARFIAGNRHVLPVLICAGALADGVPVRDLVVSPRHAMFLDGVLIPAELLVNGRTIRQMPDLPYVRYVHLELAAHDILLAEGAPSESFVDRDSRVMFQNAHEFAVLYPDDHSDTAFCAPRVESGRALEAVRRRLAARAGLAGCHAADAARAGPIDGRIDVADRCVISGWACDASRPHTRLEVEIDVDGIAVAVVVANEHRPDLEAAGKGGGRSAFSHRFAVTLATDRSHVVTVRVTPSRRLDRTVTAAVPDTDGGGSWEGAAAA